MFIFLCKRNNKTACASRKSLANIASLKVLVKKNVTNILIWLNWLHMNTKNGVPFG